MEPVSTTSPASTTSPGGPITGRPLHATHSAVGDEQVAQEGANAPLQLGLTAPKRPNFRQHELSSEIVKWAGPISVCLAIALILTPVLGTKTHSTVASIAFISGAAVGIERVIEGLWNALGSRIGVYWPMTSISRQVHGLELELNDALKPFHVHLGDALTTAQKGATVLPSYLMTAQTDLETMQRRFDDIRMHGPSNQRMQLLAACAAQSVNFLVTKYQKELPALAEGVPLANTAISGMQEFLATFKDNPGRRLLSLYLGALLGLGLAAIFQLDVFAAVNGTTAGAPATPGLRIVLTGLLIGLGSNPTHEVIQLLQEHKKKQRGKNTSTPNLAGSPAVPRS